MKLKILSDCGECLNVSNLYIGRFFCWLYSKKGSAVMLDVTTGECLLEYRKGKIEYEVF